MLLQLKNVSITYPNNKTVLEAIDLEIHEKEFIGITGKSGCGKTTLLNTIAGFQKPNSGNVFFRGQEIYNKKFSMLNFRRSLQIVFQFPENQFFETDSYREAAYGLKMLNLPESEIQSRVEYAYESLGLDFDELSSLSPFALSGGQKRRLAIASALAIFPDVLLLDEPFTGLDADGRTQLIKTLQKLHEDGKTIIMVSHDPDQLMELSDRIIVLADGNVIRDDHPELIFTDDEFCKKYCIGQPEVIELARLIGIKTSESFSYTNFIDRISIELTQRKHD